LEFGWIWRRAMYGLTWSMISWVFVYLTNENEDIYVSTFGCCVTSACAPKRLAARRSSMKWNVKNFSVLWMWVCVIIFNQEPFLAVRC
jgi:ABC-type transport system involved in Fe-S cluster assembly fused permease/ATPase subunit